MKAERGSRPSRSSRYRCVLGRTIELVSDDSRPGCSLTWHSAGTSDRLGSRSTSQLTSSRSAAR